MSDLNALSAFVHSEYTPVGTAQTDSIVAAFPLGTTPGDPDTMIECVGVEFYQLSGIDKYLPLKGSSIMVVDVF